MKWFNIAGLIFDLAGAGVIAVGVIASRTAIEKITSSGFGGPSPDAQADRRRQSTLAIVGLSLLGIGFALQIIGNWPR
jgi:hypothetical protein